MNMHVAPEDQGQIVECSYGHHNGYVYRRTWDRSDNSERFDASPMLVDDDGEYWNGPPANRRWRRISADEFDAICRAED